MAKSTNNDLDNAREN